LRAQIAADVERARALAGEESAERAGRGH
jgi:hypothetical protein